MSNISRAARKNKEEKDRRRTNTQEWLYTFGVDAGFSGKNRWENHLEITF